MTDRIGDIHIARDGFVATVTIDKPPINAVSVDLMRDLADVLERVAAARQRIDALVREVEEDADRAVAGA